MLTLTPSTIQAAAAGKLLLFSLLAFGVFAFPRFASGRRWLSLAAAAIAAIVTLPGLIFFRAATPWNQLRGDELLVAASYQRVISDGAGHDFSYPRLPPFYPPLWFYAVGGLAQAAGLDGVGAAKLGIALATVGVLPGVWFFWRWRREDDAVAAQPMWPLLLTVLPFATVDFPSVLTKPYEFLSAFGALLWFVSLRRRMTEGPWRWRTSLGFGVAAALLFSTYYLWFVMVAIAAVTFAPWRHPRAWLAHLAHWGSVAGVAVVGTAWYWWPLVASYRQWGMENWQPAFFIHADFNFFPPLEFTPRSAWLWLGLLALIRYRRRALVQPALHLLTACYVWQIVSLVATLAGDAPFQAARGFTFLGEIILAYGGAYGLAAWIAAAPPAAGMATIAAVLRERFLGPSPAPSTATRFFCCWLAIAVSLPFGLWLDQAATQQRINELRLAKPGAVELFTRYFRQQPAAARLTTLSFVPPLSAYVALPQYISHNQHYSHPAANFSRRFNYLASLASAQTPQEFHRRFVQDNPYEPIQQLLLYANGENYELYFWLDDYPNGGREAVIRWPKRLIAEPYFRPVSGLAIGGFDGWRTIERR